MTRQRIVNRNIVGDIIGPEDLNPMPVERHGSPEFYKLLEEMAEIHDSKSHDYAADTNPFGNYYFAGQMGALFAHSPYDLGFVGRIAEKIYRIANLESGGKRPKNESIADTERDILVITALWITSRRERRANRETEKPEIS